MKQPSCDCSFLPIHQHNRGPKQYILYNIECHCLFLLGSEQSSWLEYLIRRSQSSLLFQGSPEKINQEDRHMATVLTLFVWYKVYRRFITGLGSCHRWDQGLQPSKLENQTVWYCSSIQNKCPSHRGNDSGGQGKVGEPAPAEAHLLSSSPWFSSEGLHNATLISEDWCLPAPPDQVLIFSRTTWLTHPASGHPLTQ